jgi:hypothetical protein
MPFQELKLNVEQELEELFESQADDPSFELVKKEGNYFWKDTKKPATIERVLIEKMHDISKISEYWRKNHLLFAQNFAETHFHRLAESLPSKTHIAYLIKSRTAEQIVVEYVVASEK